MVEVDMRPHKRLNLKLLIPCPVFMSSMVDVLNGDRMTDSDYKEGLC